MNRNLRTRLVIGLILLVISAVLGVFAHFKPYFPGDLETTAFVQSLNGQFLTAFMIVVSQAFTGIPAVLLVIATIVIIWWRLGKLEGVVTTVAGALSPIANLFKLIVERPRPTASVANIIAPIGGFDFPSGHAFFAAMILGISAYFVLKTVPSRLLRVLLASGFIFIILLVGLSRIYMGAHWVSDVVESYIIATGVLLLLTAFYEKRKASQTRR